MAASWLARTINYLSDASLKDDVLDASESDCLAMLEAVTPKTYVRNDLEDVDRRIGFIAQDAAANAPPAFHDCGA